MFSRILPPMAALVGGVFQANKLELRKLGCHSLQP
jgi:hypothetical protein